MIPVGGITPSRCSFQDRANRRNEAALIGVAGIAAIVGVLLSRRERGSGNPARLCPIRPIRPDRSSGRIRARHYISHNPECLTPVKTRPVRPASRDYPHIDDSHQPGTTAKRRRVTTPDDQRFLRCLLSPSRPPDLDPRSSEGTSRPLGPAGWGWARRRPAVPAAGPILPAHSARSGQKKRGSICIRQIPGHD